MADAPKKKDVAVPVKHGPQSAVPRLENEIERFFGSRWPRLFDWPTAASAFDNQLPNVDVLDRKNDVCVRAEVPGFKKQNIDVSVNNNTLTIKATSRSESTDDEGDYHRREISRGYLSRTVSLPAEVDGDKAQAKLNNGMLEVTVPKVATAKRQRVEIK